MTKSREEIEELRARMVETSQALGLDDEETKPWHDVLDLAARVEELEKGIDYAILIGDKRHVSPPSLQLVDILRVLKAIKQKGQG